MRTGHLTVRELASVVGKMMAMVTAIPAVRLVTRECYAVLRPEGDDYDVQVELTSEVRHELVQAVRWVRM